MTRRNYIPYSRQDISEADIEAVSAVLRSDFLTQGPEVEKFESALSSYLAGAEVSAVSSGTAALHLCMLALQPKRVWTSPISFVASANCARYVGAEIDFVDVEPSTGNMSVDALKQKLLTAEKSGTLPDVLIPVHYSGRCCDIDGMARLAAAYKFEIIEDAAHSLGASYPEPGFSSNGAHRVGSCPKSLATILSFHPVKAITTAEGGAIATRSPEFTAKIRLLRNHGITRHFAKFHQPTTAAWYYEQQMLGFHYRLNDLQAALGTSQLTRLNSFIERRRALASRYHKELQGLRLRLPPPDETSGWHLYVVGIESDEPLARDYVFDELRRRGIGANVHYIPIHLQPDYRLLGFNIGDFPIAERFFSQSISLPIFPSLTDEDQDYVISVLKELCS